MDTPYISPRRIIHWSNSTLQKSKGFYPDPTTNAAYLNTDKFIEARFCIFIEHMLSLPHDEFLKDDDKLHQFGLLADLPDNFLKMFMLVARGIFDESGRLLDHWKDFQKELRRPERGWHEMLTRLGYVFGEGLTSDQFVAHPDSELAKFFQTYYENHQEYRIYFNSLKEQMAEGGMVTVLKPKEYFRAKLRGELGSDFKRKNGGDGGVETAIR